MALAFPARVKMQTSTTGNSSPYTVTAVTAAGYRSLAQAAAVNDIADGDEIHYIVIDTTVSNGTNLLEVGRGVWSAGASTVTRAQVYQPNNSTVTWGAGTRDFLVIDNPELFAALAGATFTGSVETALKIISRYDSVQDRRIELQSFSAQNTLYGYSRITNKTPLFIGNFYENSGTPAGEGYIQFLTGPSSGATQGPKIRETGVLETNAGAKYDAFPAGTALLFGTAPPTGWTRVNESEDIMVKVATASDTPGSAAAGSWTISGLSVSGSTDATVLTTANLPSHSHAVTYTLAQAQSGAGVGAVDSIGGGGSNTSTGNAGSGTGHTHGLSGASVASAGTWRPRYKVWVKATKD